MLFFFFFIPASKDLAQTSYFMATNRCVNSLPKTTLLNCLYFFSSNELITLVSVADYILFGYIIVHLVMLSVLSYSPILFFSPSPITCVCQTNTSIQPAPDHVLSTVQSACSRVCVHSFGLQVV